MSTELVAFKMGAGNYAKPLEDACIKFGIVTKLQKCHFLAQISVESARFTCTRENLRYRLDRFFDLFEGRNGMMSIKQAERILERGETAIAETMYGIPWGRTRLGNTEVGDGAKFIGRGLKQLTGRDNYTRYSQAMYGDDRCVQMPQLLEFLPDAALSAGWFWQNNKLNQYANCDDIVALTKRVNGGLNGLKERRLALSVAKAEFAKFG